jgi:hypothetical protein
MEQLTYSNPRMSAEIPNWPGGRNKRVIARFEIEQDAKRGERAVRTTDGAPKKLTYAKKVRIVDGSDGRTYIAELTAWEGFISIMRGDMKIQHEAIFESNPRYAQALELFAVEQACPRCNGFHANPNDHCIPSYPR